MQNQENNLREMTPLKVNTFDLNSTSLIEAVKHLKFSQPTGIKQSKTKMALM